MPKKQDKYHTTGCSSHQVLYQAPLIKDESYLKLNDSFCIKCFIQFLIQDIRKHRYNFDILLGQKIRVDLPYGQNGIYL